MSSEADDPRLLHLAPSDNVCAAARALEEGESLMFSGREITVRNPLAVGHKIAIEDIARGHKVRKYGAVIGTATREIQAGEWVHTHNLASDYIPTFQRGELEAGGGDHDLAGTKT